MSTWPPWSLPPANLPQPRAGGRNCRSGLVLVWTGCFLECTFLLEEQWKRGRHPLYHQLSHWWVPRCLHSDTIRGTRGPQETGPPQRPGCSAHTPGRSDSQLKATGHGRGPGFTAPTRHPLPWRGTGHLDSDSRAPLKPFGHQHGRDTYQPEWTAPQAPPSLGFSRQEHWSGLPFPSPMHESER